MVVPETVTDEEFAAHQIEFLRRVFAHSAYLREQSRPTPVSDAFLAAVVGLMEALDINAPDDAQRCALQLQRIFKSVFPGSNLEAHPCESRVGAAKANAGKEDAVQVDAMQAGVGQTGHVDDDTG
ncbi:hypothetical protein [Paraburkholderia sp. DHOC27]|uniref:hypothetical protein n=1 Tax=Paraburkholderia sp. DHOC27 TaxID=2303330 RepID=UPI0015F3076E|nr:hypothetical protein [Paraburkholderia sp. DHOC27]